MKNRSLKLDDDTLNNIIKKYGGKELNKYTEKEEEEEEEEEEPIIIKGRNNEKENKYYNKYLLEQKQTRAEIQRKRYNNLNVSLVCPICSIDTNLNKINIHFKGKKCNNLSKLLDDARLLKIKQKINRITKTAIDKNLNKKEQDDNINEILEE